MEYEEYLEKKKEALSKFPDSFIKQVYFDPAASAVIEALINKQDPYELLYDILLQNIEMSRKINELSLLLPPKKINLT